MRALHAQLVSDSLEVLLVVAAAPQVEEEVDGAENEAHPANRYPKQPADQDREKRGESPENRTPQIDAPKHVVVDIVNPLAV